MRLIFPAYSLRHAGCSSWHSTAAPRRHSRHWQRAVMRDRRRRRAELLHSLFSRRRRRRRRSCSERTYAAAHYPRRLALAVRRLPARPQSGRAAAGQSGQWAPSSGSRQFTRRRRRLDSAVSGTGRDALRTELNTGVASVERSAPNCTERFQFPHNSRSPAGRRSTCRRRTSHLAD